MTQTAKIFTNGRSQAVRLPASFRFDTKEVFIRQDAQTGDVILSRRPDSWAELVTLIQTAQAEQAIPADFLNPAERAEQALNRDPFAD